MRGVRRGVSDAVGKVITSVYRRHRPWKYQLRMLLKYGCEVRLTNFHWKVYKEMLRFGEDLAAVTGLSFRPAKYSTSTYFQVGEDREVSVKEVGLIGRGLSSFKRIVRYILVISAVFAILTMLLGYLLGP